MLASSSSSSQPAEPRQPGLSASWPLAAEAASERSPSAAPSSPAAVGRVDIATDIPYGVRKASLQRRGQECVEERSRLRAGLKFVDKVLDETEEALKLRPRKVDKLTAGTYHACFRHLHWVLGRCQQMQDQAEALEDADSSRLYDHAVSADYALLSVEIVTRHDRSQQLLQILRAGDVEEQGEWKLGAPHQSCGHFAEWVLGAMAVCSSRVCVRDTPCAGGVDLRKAAAQC
uniref:Uncharacterized protein n=1 Tax=Alexandrium andersonii TaxID=327968 RepID=A0A7S2DN62_9DINO|mmetsp:Transcript_56874/g.128044  ORF Transcript_56874/g.128044 Transcript_56874/m.128044 type:complete len:231 (+) Transcript_56874:144-836(+)